MSASIPCQRRVKDHVEREINHFAHGKSHTSPDTETDIKNLQDAYKAEEIHAFIPGRTLTDKDKEKDYIALEAESTRLQGMITRWRNNRLSKVDTTEDFDPYDFD